MARDYSTVTETPDERISLEAASMLYTRYQFARSLASGRRVLEVACGSGQGLGFVKGSAAFVVGADITRPLLQQAAITYRGSIPLVQLDAERLPFRDEAFDVVTLHEAIYYLPHAERFIEEAHRVLKPAGVLLVVSINAEWKDFNPSSFATRYYTAAALAELLRTRFPAVEILAGFPAVAASSPGRLLSLIKRTAVRLKLIPRTMRGKRLLKRAFLGPLKSVPRELEDGFAAYDVPRAVDAHESAGHFKVLYALGRRERDG